MSCCFCYTFQLYHCNAECNFLVDWTTWIWYGWGHTGVAVLLTGFAISWQQNQVTRQLHLCDLTHLKMIHYYTPRLTKLEGGVLDSPCPSIRLSVRPSVCRRHGFRSISQVWFGISISNFIGMLMVAIGKSLVAILAFWFPDSNFTFALNINSKLQWHNTYIYG